jgi:hypothetical protein
MDWEWDWNTVTDPLKDMLTVIGEYLPRIVAAIVVLLIAWLLAKILKAVVCRILRTARVDDRVNSWLDRDKINRLTITDTIGKLVFWLVLLISIPAVIGVLGLEGVEEPFRNMADSILSAVPAILGAIAVLLIGYFLARLAYAFISSFLKKVGFDNILVKLEISKEAPTGEWTPSRVAGYIAFLVIMLISIIAAADLFNFDSVENLVTDLTAFVGKVILGIVIIAVGVFLAHIAGKAIVATKRQQADLLAILARVAILLLAGAMGFQAMGFANDVITLGFGLILGAVAVAVAIAFGVGGRESAARQLEKWIKTSETKTE